MVGEKLRINQSLKTLEDAKSNYGRFSTKQSPSRLSAFMDLGMMVSKGIANIWSLKLLMKRNRAFQNLIDRARKLGFEEFPLIQRLHISDNPKVSPWSWYLTVRFIPLENKKQRIFARRILIQSLEKRFEEVKSQYGWIARFLSVRIDREESRKAKLRKQIKNAISKLRRSIANIKIGVE